MSTIREPSEVSCAGGSAGGRRGIRPLSPTAARASRTRAAGCPASTITVMTSPGATTADGAAPVTPEYPAHWEADVVLRDGSTMHIRPIRPSDADALQQFHRSQSAQSIYFRFFAPMERLSDRDLDRFTHVDHRQRVALVLVERTGSHERIAAVGRFDRLEDDGDVAEVAFNVADAAQGRGLGSILLEHLAAAGRELGLRKFVADVLPSNNRMLRVFADAGYDTTQSYADGVVEVSVPLRATDRSLAVLAERERRADAVSMAALLAPTGALVLRNGDEGTLLGDLVLERLAGSGYGGRVVVASEVADLDDLDAPLPTLALVAAPPELVIEALPVLAGGGVRVIVLVSGGFASTGASGLTSQRALVRGLREHGLRLVGPRSFGVFSRTDDGSLDATLASEPIAVGDVGVFCQSSAAARGMLHEAGRRGLGLSTFLASGRRVDISGNDAMQYWSGDDGTRVACLYLESIGNPRKFSRIARRLTSRTPVVVAIAGTTGQQRLPGHPVRTSTAPRRVLEQMMRQAGVLLASSVTEQLDWAMLLSAQPLPEGDRVLVVSNSGSQAAVLADLVREHGLSVAGDPVALPPTVTAEEFDAALVAAGEQADWDMAVVAHGPFGIDLGARPAASIAALSTRSGLPVAAVVLGRTGLHPDLTAATADGGATSVPGFVDGAAAVAALAAARRHARRRDEAESSRVDPPDIRRRHARALTQEHLLGVPAGTSVRMPNDRAGELLAAYGLTLWPATRVTDVEAAVAAAVSIGWPVALKAGDEVLRHRADLGGVRLDLSTPDEIADAFASISDRMASIGRRNVALEVQRMAPTGAACVVTGVEDELYGPIVGFGLAGDAVEMLDDVEYRIPPLSAADVADLVRAPRAAPRLLGYRGLPALDVAALEDVVARVSVLKEELPEVRAVALNPVLVSENGAAILSATVDLAPSERGDMERRALP